MFGKGASVLVDSDNCHVLTADEMHSDSLLRSYLLPDETPYVMLKSAKEEYIFTDCAFITVTGNSAFGTKKNVARYEYFENILSGVSLQSPGVGATDIDGALSFYLNNSSSISIDIKKSEWESAKPIYHTLIRLQRQQHLNEKTFALQRDVFQKMWVTVDDPNKAKNMAFQYAIESVSVFTPVSYKAIWDTYQRY